MDNCQLLCRCATISKIVRGWGKGKPVQRAANQLRCHSEPVLKLVWESPSYSRLQINYGVIPNQCAHWCGNLPRHCDRVLLLMEIATKVLITGSQ